MSFTRLFPSPPGRCAAQGGAKARPAAARPACPEPRAHPWASPARPGPALPSPALRVRTFLAQDLGDPATAPCSRSLGGTKRADGAHPRPGPGRLDLPPLSGVLSAVLLFGLICRDPGRWHAFLSLTCAPGTVVGCKVAGSLPGRSRPFSNSPTDLSPPWLARPAKVGKPLFVVLCSFPC